MKCPPECQLHKTRFVLQSASLIEWMGGAKELIDGWRRSVEPANQDQACLPQSWDDIVHRFMVRNNHDKTVALKHVVI